MESLLTLPTVQLVRRASMALSIVCGLYVIYSLLSGNSLVTVASIHYGKADFCILKPMPALDGPTQDRPLWTVAAPYQSRDIFSSGPVGMQGSVENTPAGQLPAHFKIVGIVIADNPQVIIEDSFIHQTYFIDPHHAQAGIRMLRANANQVVINYQGNDIPIAVKRNG